VPKIISACCELVKLCRINRSGPVFLRHTVYRSYNGRRIGTRMRATYWTVLSSITLNDP